MSTNQNRQLFFVIVCAFIFFPAALYICVRKEILSLRSAIFIGTILLGCFGIFASQNGTAESLGVSNILAAFVILQPAIPDEVIGALSTLFLRSFMTLGLLIIAFLTFIRGHINEHEAIRFVIGDNFLNLSISSYVAQLIGGLLGILALGMLVISVARFLRVK